MKGRIVTRGDVADAARSLIGTPFHHQGRSRAGLDCAGLIVESCRIAGVNGLPDTIDYGPIPNPAILLERLQAIADQIRPVDLVPGDIVCIKWREQEGTHVGIVTGRGADGLVVFCHAYQGSGKVVENRLGHLWRRQLHSCWRLRGVSDG